MPVLACELCLTSVGAAQADKPQSDADQLQEITVTAERREEGLQRVPVAVSVVQGSLATKQGVIDTNDLTIAVPGLQFAYGPAGVSPFIRGVGSTYSSAGAEPSVATYVDGVYIGSSEGSLFSFNNIDRIEVLKGPQGTLFGRNATGGVVQVITKDPSPTPSADVTIGYANYDTTTATFYGTTGILPTLSTDLAVYAKDQDNGWGHNLFNGSKTYTNSEYAVRNKWLWAPTSSTQVRLALSYDSLNSELPLGFKVFPGVVTYGGAGYPGFYNTDANLNDRFTDKHSIAALTIAQDVGFATFKSITSFQRNDVHWTLDFDGGPTPYANAIFPEPDSATTQEFNLSSANDSRIKWLVGLYYFDGNAAYDPLSLSGTSFGGATIDIRGHENTKSYAVYEQTTFEVAESTHLTAGIRYTKDERDVSGTTTIEGVGEIASAAQSKDFEKMTWRLALDRQFTADVLGYLSYNRGFKSGVFNVISYAAPAVNPETIDAYEIGFKSEYLDHRLRVNVASFYDKYKNLQVPEASEGTELVLNAASAEIYGMEADITAIPISHLTIDAGISLLHGRYTDFPNAPFYTSLPGGGNAITSINASGFEMEQAPRATLSLTANYKVPTSIGDFDITGTYYYSDHFYWDNSEQRRSPAYSLLNATIGWLNPSGRYGIQLWAKNITNVEYFGFQQESAYASYFSPAAPRTFGVTLSAHF